MNAIVKSAKRKVRSLLKRAQTLVIRTASRSRIGSTLYYAFEGSFGREHRATLAGKVMYRESVTRPQGTSSLLRRNVHRIEKGLIMRPRRTPFGLNYIKETVDAYVAACRANVDTAELAWARDVLSEYMSVNPPHPVIDPLRDAVVSIGDPAPAESRATRRTPYRRDPSQAPSISYDEFLKLARFRRSVRWFLPKAVPRDAIEKAVVVAGYSPSACNRQPYQFRVFDDPELVRQVIELPMGTGGFGHQVPAVAVVVGRQRSYFSERDRHLIYIDGALAGMSFVYALEVQGLGSCCINWPDVESREAKMAKLLKLAPDERPIMLIAIGYPDPDGSVPHSVKKSVASVCRFNFE